MKKNTLTVAKPFLGMQIGDKLECDKVGKCFVYAEEHKSDNCFCSHTCAISKDYADQLIEDGFLNNVSNKEETTFVNVFDEISSLAEKYTSELDNIDEDMTQLPECMKLERRTVLSNMIKLLEHLNSLKK